MPGKLSIKQLGAVLIGLYFLSGITSLAYEILWVRMLSLEFGVSIFGVIITVSSFMSGLGLGSLLGHRLLTKFLNPIRVFAILELTVACLALIMPLMFQLVESLLLSSGVGGPLFTWYAFELVFAGILLFIPAMLMGAGFPVVLRAIQNTNVSIAHIYGINAIGAAFGALMPLFLLPILGWLYSIRVIALLGLLIALAAFVASLNNGSQKQLENHVKLNHAASKMHLFLYAGIGASALMLEVGWTRLFGMLLLRTEYVIAIIISVFLLGVGIGSVLSEYMKQKIWFVILPIASCSFVIVSLWLIPSISTWAVSQDKETLWQVMMWQGSILAMLTFPVTLILGAWFPLLTRRFGDDDRAGSMLYGVNSVGSALGAIIAGFILTPTIGTSASVVVSGLLLLIIGVFWAHSHKWWFLLPVMLLLGYPVMHMPSVEQLLPAQYKNSNDIFYHEDAISITHVVERNDGQRVLLADLQRMDASSEPTAVESQKNQARLPLLMHPAPGRVLFLGLGTGISASAALSFPDLQIDAVELSQGAITAAGNWFADVNNNVSHHITIFRDDARHYLMTSQVQYDVIIGDLFHPDLVGRAALLSTQQFQRARQHLSSNGIFVQWLALNQFDVESLQIVLRSFSQIYPDAVLFLDGFRLAMVGAAQFEGSTALIRNLNRMSVVAQEITTGTEGPWTWLGRYWGRVHISDGKVQQEWEPIIEFRLPQARVSGELDLVKVLNYLFHQRPAVNQAAKELNVDDTDFAAFERAYIATELAQRSWFAFLTEKPAEGQRLLQLAYQANPKDRWIGLAVADAALASYEANPGSVDEREFLTSILRIRPDHVDVLKRLWQLESNAGHLEKANEYRSRLALISPLDKRVQDSNK